MRRVGTVPFERVGLVPTLGLLAVGATSVGLAVASANAAPASTPAIAAPSIVVVASAPPPVVTPAAPAPSLCAPRVTVLFTLGEGQPPITTATRLASFVDWLKQHPDTTLLVNGHADATGDEDKNVALSHRRARAVAKLVEEAGVARSRITARGFGAYQPLEGEDETDGDNRRVNLRVRGLPACATPEEVIAP